MKRLATILLLLLAVASATRAQIGYQPLVREGVRWICFEAIDDWYWDHQTYRIYQYEFKGDSVFFREQYGTQIQYKKLYCKDLFRFTFYTYEDSITNLTNVQDKNNVQGELVDYWRESDKVVYKIGGKWESDNSVYDFTNRDTALVCKWGDPKYYPMPFVGTDSIDGKPCRKYVGLHWYTGEQLENCSVIESVGYDGYYGDLIYPNPNQDGPTGWHHNYGLLCLADLNGKVLYKGEEFHVYQLVLNALSDISGDGRVDVADINAAVAAVMGIGENAKADVNGDGTIDIADINTIINVILNAPK